jgi:uncharacterized membrane protein (UPF0127 family)
MTRRAALAALTMLLAAGTGAEAAVMQPLTIESANGPHRFNVELAVTPEEMMQGLMFRRSLAPDAGMLFIYETPQRASFWMKNTLIPLDMLFIAPDGRILNIHERAVPQSLEPIPSDGPVRAVLEVNGGTAARLGIKPGDRVVSAIFEKKG